MVKEGRVVRASEVDQRPAFVLRLVLRGRATSSIREFTVQVETSKSGSHDTMNVGADYATAEDVECVADVANRMTRKRLYMRQTTNMYIGMSSLTLTYSHLSEPGGRTCKPPRRLWRNDCNVTFIKPLG